MCAGGGTWERRHKKEATRGTLELGESHVLAGLKSHEWLAATCLRRLGSEATLVHNLSDIACHVAGVVEAEVTPHDRAGAVPLT